MPNVLDCVVGIVIVARAGRVMFFVLIILLICVRLMFPSVGNVAARDLRMLVDCAELFDFVVCSPVLFVRFVVVERATVFFAALRAVMLRFVPVFVLVAVREIIFFDVSRVIVFEPRSTASTDATLKIIAPIKSKILFILSTINICYQNQDCLTSKMKKKNPTIVGFF